ncbi:hypothetical protein F4604DRAFT_22107 [Suillus subluteus]|nr:hypothetical protein F4604DRAFT_22107 [Suillus subluteus]
MRKSESAIRTVIHAQLDNCPICVLDTTAGLLCNREAQTRIFTTSTEYNETLLFKMKRVEEVVGMYLSCVMLSHRWEGKEPLLYDIQDKTVHDLDSSGGIVKLQSFCKVARRAECRWAWSDTSTRLTMPSSRNWTLYLNDRSSNHEESVVIMQELGDAVGIELQALVAFRPGMTSTREKLQWSSTRVTTLQEDIANSLFGIFGVYLPVIYCEKKQNALGRLLQEVVTRSGDISALDWIGTPSEFNSCLPADITSYLLRHPYCHLCPKMRWRNQCPSCKRSWPWGWLRNFMPCLTS